MPAREWRDLLRFSYGSYEVPPHDPFALVVSGQQANVPAVSVARVAHPALRPHGGDSVAWSAHAALRIDAAVDLSQDRHAAALLPEERLSRAVREQQEFLRRLLNPELHIVFDLRTLHDPTSPYFRTAIIVRSWGDSEDGARQRAREVTESLAHWVPKHVLVSAVTDMAELSGLLDPFDGQEDLAATLVTRDEVVTVPTRSDLKVGYLYSVTPFGTPWRIGQRSTVPCGLHQRPSF